MSPQAHEVDSNSDLQLEKDMARYQIEGVVIYQEGYEVGVRGYDRSSNPYLDGNWISEVWMEGWLCGHMAFKALDEPLLRMPD